MKKEEDKFHKSESSSSNNINNTTPSTPSERLKNESKYEYTHRKILELVLEMLNSDEKEENINVVTICKKLSMDRGTFYNHFNSIEEVYSKLDESIYLTIKNQLTIDFLFSDPAKFLDFVLDVVDKNSNIILKYIKEDTKEYNSTLYKILSFIFEQSVINYPDVNKDRINDYILFCYGGSKRILIDWIENGKVESKSDIASKLSTLTGLLINYIK